MRKMALVIGGVMGVVLVAVGGFVGFKVGTAKFDFSNTPYPKIQASTDPAVIERGAYVVHNVAHCSTCHGEMDGKIDMATFELDRSKPLAGGYRMEAGPFGTFYAQNLTPDPETGIGRYSDEELARMIRNAVGADGRFLPMMRFAQGPMSDEDLTAVISYLRAQKPVKKAVPRDEFGILAKMLSDSFAPRSGPSPQHVESAEPSVARGEYLATGPALCSGCHSPTDPMEGFALVGPEFSGAMNADPDSTEEGWEIIAPNLTPDPKTGVTGMWDEEQFVERMKGGRVITGSHMPWEAFAQMTDSDLRSIYRYLKTVPPTANDVGPTRRKM